MTFQAVLVHIVFLSLFPFSASLKIKATTSLAANRRGHAGLLVPETGWKYEKGYIVDPKGTRVFKALVDEKLGEGAFGAVVKVKNLLFGTATNMKVNGKDAPEIMAMKVIKAKEVESALEEAPNMKKVQPNRWVPFILKELLIKKDLYLIMELALGKSMMQNLASRFPLPLDETKRAFKQLVKAIEICHARDVAHRDLKPQNIQWDGSELKLLDFGLAANLTNGAEARRNGKNKLSTKAGTAAYVAPEVLTKSYYEGPPADVWGLGVVLYVLLTATFPFDGDTDYEILSAVKIGYYSAKPIKKFDGAQDLMKQLLVMDPKKRLTATQILDHAFIKDTPCPEQEAPTVSQSLSESDLGHVVLPDAADEEAERLRELSVADDVCVSKGEYTHRLMFNKLKQFCCCSDADLSTAACICRAGKSGFMSLSTGAVCSGASGKAEARAYVHPGRGHCS